MQSDSTSASPKHDPSVPPKEGACVFFTIPRELRDEIYKYALTYDFGLVVVLSDEGLDGVQAVLNEAEFRPTTYSRYYRLREASRNRNESLNALRLVSRQLYHETAWLHFKLNHISFIPEDSAESLVGFSLLVERCLSSWAPHVRSVSVHSWKWPTEVLSVITGSSLARLCDQNPHIMLALHLEHLDFPSVNLNRKMYFPMAYKIHQFIQGSQFDQLGEEFARFCEDWGGPPPAPSHVPANLKVFPCSGGITKGDFRTYSSYTTLHGIYNFADVGFELIRGWYEQGMGQGSA